MVGLGAPELLIILAVVLLLFGGAKLPQLARCLGQAKKEFEDGHRRRRAHRRPRAPPHQGLIGIGRPARQSEIPANRRSISTTAVVLIHWPAWPAPAAPLRDRRPPRRASTGAEILRASTSRSAPARSTP